MLIALRGRWRDVLHGFWFVPGVVVIAFVALALLVLWVDRRGGTVGLQFLFSGSGSAARSVLATIATSVITVAGLSLSITIVALQLVSGQFSPRATRTLLADRTNQISAGAFVGIFVYCLLVLRSVRDESGDFGGFVPSLSVSVAIVLGVAGLGLLLGFIHNMAQSIKLPAIAGRIGRETLDATRVLYPAGHGRAYAVGAEEEAARWAAEEGPGTPVRPARAGYVQQVRLTELVRSLDRPGTRIQLLVRPGDFVTGGGPAATIRPSLAAGEEDVATRVGHAIVVADERDLGQDVAFGIQQLKDIVLRAVSPSVNDPSTAITCIGYLAACLERLAVGRYPAEVRAFHEEDAVVAAPAVSFDEHAEEAFGQLVPHADDVRVAEAALRAIALAAGAAAREGLAAHLPPLVDLAERLGDAALSALRSDSERARILAAAERVRLVAGPTPAVAG